MHFQSLLGLSLKIICAKVRNLIKDRCVLTEKWISREYGKSEGHFDSDGPNNVKTGNQCEKVVSVLFSRFGDFPSGNAPATRYPTGKLLKVSNPKRIEPGLSQ
jgi:hypothetical protein